MIFVPLFLLFLAVRLLILLTSIESLFTLEEFVRGTAAYDLIVHGRHFSIWNYLADEYSGGSLWIGLAAVPIFKMLGPSLFALKLVPLIFAAATLALAILFLEKNFGREAALAGAWLFIFSPPATAGMSLVAMGFHSESIVFTAAAFLFFYDFLFSEKRRIWSLVLAGFVSGLGFSFTYITLIGTAACLAAWLILRKEWTFKNGALWTLAFLAGSIPWIAFNVSHGFLGWGFLTQNFSNQDSGLIQRLMEFDYRFLKIFLKSWPLSFGFELFTPWRIPVLSYLYYGLTLLGIAGIFHINFYRYNPLQRRLLPLACYLVLFLLIYAASYFDIPVGILMSSRYFIPLHFACMLLIAGGCTQSKMLRHLVLTLILLGAGGQAFMVFREPFGRGLHYRGYSYFILGKEWSFVFEPLPQALEQVAKLTTDWDYEIRREFYFGLVTHADFNHGQDVQKSFLESLEKAPEYRSFLTERFGSFLGWNDPGGIHRHIHFTNRNLSDEEKDYFYSGLFSGLHRLPRYAPLLRLIDPRFRRWFYFDLGQFLYFSKNKKDKEMAGKIAAALGHEEKIWFYRGAGKASIAGWVYYGWGFHGSLEKIKPRIPEKYQKDILWGIGWGLAGEWQADRRRSLDWIERIPLPNKAAARAGFEAWQERYLV